VRFTLFERARGVLALHDVRNTMFIKD